MAQELGRYELLDGKVYAMAPERLGHARTKARVWQALDRAITARGLPCEALPDGMTVAINAATSFEPDALVRCGDPLDPDATAIAGPLIVVEVIAPGSRGIDSNAKLEAYLGLPSVAHYLVLDPQRRALIHYTRQPDGSPAIRIHHQGSLVLDPPGIALEIGDCFPAPEPG
jgi:Uma2 family endonuclease